MSPRERVKKHSRSRVGAKIKRGGVVRDTLLLGEKEQDFVRFPDFARSSFR
jgi:hypothetical protein